MALRQTRRKRHMQEIALNITSLMDVLTVLIFFLIRTLTVSSESLSVPENLKLPAVETDGKVEESTVVSLSRQELRVNHDVIVKLDRANRFPASEVAEDGRTLSKVRVRLEKEREKKRQVLNTKGMADMIAPGRIVVQADKDLPFDTVKYLLHTVTVSGYTDLQFLTVAKEEN